MALKGTLKNIGIADVLQLIGQQQKTGTLHLRHRQEEVRVVFREGSILSAAKYLGKKEDPLGTTLVRAGALTELELEQATEMLRKTSSTLAAVLFQENFVTEAQLRRALKRQTTETLYRVLEWKRGKYEFKQGEVAIARIELSPLGVEGVLMEAFRRQDEWPSLRRLIPSDDDTFEKIGPWGGEGSANGDARLSPEGIVYGLINSERSAGSLAELAGLDSFETFQALANLIKSSVIQVSPRSGAVPPAPRLSASKLSLPIHLSLFLGAALIVALGSSTGKRIQALKRPPTSTYSDPATRRFLSRAQLARISAAIAVFRLENKEVPDALDALVAKGLLSSDDLRYPWRETYYYRKTSSADFVLLPPLR